MALGPGKYDELCTQAREGAQAEGAVVVIFNGTRGTGFSVQGSIAVHKIVRDTLNAMVAGVRGDMRYESMRSLLEELRTARPLLLYGDAWIDRINEVLEMPDDSKPDR